MELLDREYAIQQEQTQYNRWRDEISDAWDRVNTLGRVDNVASEVLGLPVGTPSQDAREQMVEAQRQAALYEQQLAAAQQEVEGELQETEKAIAYQTLNSIAAQAFSNPQDAYTVINAIRRNNGIIPDSIWNAMENGDIQINGPLGEIQNLAMKIDDSQVRSLITTDLPNTMEAIRKEAGKITPSVVDADGARNYIDNYIITTPMYGEEPELTENGRLQIIEYLESLNKAGYLNDEDTISIGAEYGIVF
jgi:hypothetical protein